MPENLRNPDDPAVHAEQDQAIERFISFYRREPDYLAGPDQVTDELWKFAATLQPAAEGLARHFPDIAMYVGVVARGDEPIIGLSAYQEWMTHDPAAGALNILPRFDSNKHIRLRLAAYDPGCNDIEEYHKVLQNPAEDFDTITTIGLTNTYALPRTAVGLEALQKTFSDTALDTEGRPLYSHYPLDAECSDLLATSQQLLVHFSPEALQIYQEFGTLGLTRFRLYQLVNGFRAGLNLG